MGLTEVGRGKAELDPVLSNPVQSTYVRQSPATAIHSCMMHATPTLMNFIIHSSLRKGGPQTEVSSCQFVAPFDSHASMLMLVAKSDHQMICCLRRSASSVSCRQVAKCGCGAASTVSFGSLEKLVGFSSLCNWAVRLLRDNAAFPYMTNSYYII